MADYSDQSERLVFKMLAGIVGAEEEALQILVDPNTDRHYLDRLVGDMSLYAVPHTREIDRVLRQLLNHESKYVFLSALQCLLRASWSDDEDMLASLPIPPERAKYATSLVQVLKEARR